MTKLAEIEMNLTGIMKEFLDHCERHEDLNGKQLLLEAYTRIVSKYDQD